MVKLEEKRINHGQVQQAKPQLGQKDYGQVKKEYAKEYSTLRGKEQDGWLRWFWFEINGQDEEEPLMNLACGELEVSELGVSYHELAMSWI